MAPYVLPKVLPSASEGVAPLQSRRGSRHNFISVVVATLGIDAKQIALFLRGESRVNCFPLLANANRFNENPWPESGEAAASSEAAAAVEGIAEAVDMIAASGGGFQFLAGVVVTDAILGGKL